VTTAQRVLAAAQSRLGLAEQPKGSNNVPGVTDQFWFWNDAWCDMFVSVCFVDAGLDIKFASCTASTRAYQDKSIGTWLGKPDVSEVNPGDQVLFGPSGGSHTGLVAAVDVVNQRILTYEGNWGDRSQALWRNYHDGYVFGFGRPNYDGVPAPVAVPSRAKPASYQAGAASPYLALYVDGVLGPKSWSAVQWALNDAAVPDKAGTTPIAVDGEAGPSTNSSLQLHVGADVDGEFGPNSTKALQTHLGVGVDGEWGPTTTKALQKALNEKRF
jgi:hypothetical protein